LLPERAQFLIYFGGTKLAPRQTNVKREGNMKFKHRYRLGLDIGTNSIGWCVLRLNEHDEPIGIIRAGSRIFSDGRSPKTLASLAADRRAARQMRRRHDRVLKRMARFMKGLVRFGLMPLDDEEVEVDSSLEAGATELSGDVRRRARTAGRVMTIAGHTVHLTDPIIDRIIKMPGRSEQISPRIRILWFISKP
jgi:hypothetical protein